MTARGGRRAHEGEPAVEIPADGGTFVERESKISLASDMEREKELKKSKKMKRAASQPLMKQFQESDREEHVRNKGTTLKLKHSLDGITKQVTCMTIYKRQRKKPCEEFSGEKYGLHRQEMRTRAARLQKQLKARWSIEQLIDEQLSHFQAVYDSAPTTMKDVTQLLTPKEASAHELAAASWLGVEQVLSQLINDVRIEEAVIDEEMAEIQATCVFHLPFSPVRVESSGPALACIQSEFKKIHLVVTKAQNLRSKALELVVKKVLSNTDAAEFLVAFARFQDSIHQFSMQYKLRKGTGFYTCQGTWSLA
ncbi:hypothetical protein Adt_29109 [Abeliophyllum distichum]|uniref:DOG1 domain-containing protein n=1 Tax=Abeliophyllum distichum TaxID=126358 RepID=A0ABD1RYF5_9LAMI